MTDNVLQTERLNLRRFRYEDAGFVLALLNEPSFKEFIGDKGVETLDDARRYIELGPLASYEEHGWGVYVVVEKSERLPIGMCGLFKRENLPCPDLGFAFLSRYFRRGYALEASRGVICYARDALGLPLLAAIVDPENRRSIALLGRLGFGYDGRYAMPGEDKDLACYLVRPGDQA